MFALIVIGAVVRTTGSGLACPDWPLCEGRLIPRFEAHVLIEWFHRLVALLVSLLLFATAAWVIAHRGLRARLGRLLAIALVLLFAQVVLGALTVWKLLSPAVVSSHLAVALLLFSTLLAMTLIAHREAAPEPADVSPRPGGLMPAFVLATALTYVQVLLGGLVSTNHAGLACPDWPTCFGQWFPPLEGLVGLQMMHRYGAYVLLVVLLNAALRGRRAPDPRVALGGTLALTLVVAQMVLGVLNVLLGTPVWLSAAHLATAAALLAILVMTTYRVAALPAQALKPAPAEAR